MPVGENAPQIDAETQSMIDFLMLQLANTLNNIRIYREASEREKLAAIGSFSSGILHNLKNPVDGLRMMIEALYYDMPKHDPRFDYVNELYQGVLHLKNTLLHSFEFVTQSEARGKCGCSHHHPGDHRTFFRDELSAGGFAVCAGKYRRERQRAAAESGAGKHHFQRVGGLRR
ncbi:MAG: hypothetical protein R3C26_21940 [Calditrichia bacterium]